LTFKHDLDSVKVNRHAKYLGQCHLVQKLMSGQTYRHTHTHTHTHSVLIALLGPLKWLVTNNVNNSGYFY